MSVPIGAMHSDSVVKAGADGMADTTATNGTPHPHPKGHHPPHPLETLMTADELERISDVFREFETGPGLGVMLPKVSWKRLNKY